MKVAIVRGKFLNAYEMQSFAPLSDTYEMTAFGSLIPYHEAFPFPVQKLLSPMDLPEFPYKMQIINRLWKDAQYLYGLEDALRGFDLVHAAETYYHYTQQALEAKRRGNVKHVIATVLENIPFNNEGIRGRRAFKKRSRDQLDHIIALTEKTKEVLILEGADAEKITVIGHGIDTERFAPGKNHFQKLGDSRKKDFTILYCGRLELYKGVFELLYAFEYLVRTVPGVRLRLSIVGSGSQGDAMRAMESRLQIDHLVTHSEASYADMPQVMRSADILVVPSKPIYTFQEQYCTVLLEGQAAGMPIVTTATGGIYENVGDAGLIVPPADYMALAMAVHTFITEPSARLTYAKKARDRARTVHDRHLIARKIAGVYERFRS